MTTVSLILISFSFFMNQIILKNRRNHCVYKYNNAIVNLITNQNVMKTLSRLLFL